MWGKRSGVEVIKQKSGADPSAVIFDALSAASRAPIDLVIVDTAGRLHTKSNLMAELEKMKRTAAKIVPGAPHDVLLVLDATTGQNGLNQAREFWSHAGVTGIVLTKLDGTAKGGIVVAIARELNLPIRFVGTGEQIDDLVPFDPQTYVNSLFDKPKRTTRIGYRRALELALARRSPCSSESNRRRGCRQERRALGRGLSRIRQARPRRNRRAEKSGRERARRNSLRQSRTLLPHGPHRSLHESDHRSRHQARRRRDAGPEPRSCRPRIRAISPRRNRSDSRTVHEPQARELNEEFAKWIRTGLPFVTLKTALTLDGQIASRSGSTT